MQGHPLPFLVMVGELGATKDSTRLWKYPISAGCSVAVVIETRASLEV